MHTVRADLGLQVRNQKFSASTCPLAGRHSVCGSSLSRCTSRRSDRTFKLSSCRIRLQAASEACSSSEHAEAVWRYCSFHHSGSCACYFPCPCLQAPLLAVFPPLDPCRHRRHECWHLAVAAAAAITGMIGAPEAARDPSESIISPPRTACCRN